MNKSDELFSAFSMLSKKEKEAFLLKIKSVEGERQTKKEEPSLLTPENIQNNRFANDFFCHHCESRHVVRYGKRPDGTQRFRCVDCRKIFQATTNTVLGKNTYQNQEKLRMYVNCMCKELSVRQSAEICGITVPTAFAWRHKILNALRNTCEHQMLSGTVELDRTFFNLSFKGSRHASEFKHLIEKYDKDKESLQQVCVPLAVGREGGFTGKVSTLGCSSTDTILSAIKDHLTSQSKLLADAEISKNNQHGKVLRNVNLTTVKGINEDRSLDAVRKFKQGINDSINLKFRGVATKYINDYILWYGFLHISKQKPKECEKLLYDIALYSICSINTRSVGKRILPIELSSGQKMLLSEFLDGLAENTMND